MKMATTSRKPRAAVIIVVALAVFGPGLYHLARLSWQQRALAHRLRELEARTEALHDKHQRLQTDPVYVEDRIRSTFKVAKPGELVVPLETDPLRETR